METNSKPYCVYLTIYSGHNLPSFYIGSKDVASVLAGYRGSVSSKKWKHVWKEELRNRPELFLTYIVSQHETRKQAFIEEDKLQRAVDAVNSKDFVNEAYVSKMFRHGPHDPEAIQKMKASRDEFLQSVGKAAWYAEMAKRQKITKQKRWANLELQKIKSANIANGQNNRTQEEKDIHSEKIAKGWANRTDAQKKEFSELRSKIARAQFSNLSDAQRAQNSKIRSEMQVRLTCPHCGKTGIKPNMNRWHFTNCKSVKCLS